MRTTSSLITRLFGLALPLVGCSQDWSAPAKEDAGDAGALQDGQVDAGSSDDGAVDGDGAIDGGVLSDGDTPVAPDSTTPQPCGSISCNNGSVCVGGACSCVAGWEGPSCQQDIDECAGANHGCPAEYPCENQPGGYTCAGQGADGPLPKRAGTGTLEQLGWQLSDTGASLLDTHTGLRWEKGPSATTYRDSDSARAHCEQLNAQGFEGANRGWRLPSLLELFALVQGETIARPAGYDLFFGNNTDVWTSSYHPTTHRKAYFWAYNTDYQDFDPASATPSEVFARCVRREQPACLLPSHKRLVTAGSVVRDLCTGLTWERDPELKNRTYQDSQSYCAKLTLDNRTWRVPTFVELYSLVNGKLRAANPSVAAIPSQFITDVHGYYVTTTKAASAANADAQAAGHAWSQVTVKGDGQGQYTEWIDAVPPFSTYVRCVSDGI